MRKFIIIFICLVVMGMGVLVTPAFSQTDTITLTAGPPKGTDALYVSIIGNQGNATYYYWIVTKYTIGSSKPFGPTMVTRAPNILTPTNYIRINWNPAPKAISYDILRTTTSNLPSGSCTCALALGDTGTTINDTGGALSPYTIVSSTNTTASIMLDNTNYTTPTLVLDKPLAAPGLSGGGGGGGTVVTGATNLQTPNAIPKVSTPGTITESGCIIDNGDILNCPGGVNLGSGPTLLTLRPIDPATVGIPPANRVYFYISSLTNNTEVKDSAGVVHNLANTDGLAEGVTNLYHTTLRARQAISADAPLTYNASTGVIQCAACGGAGTTLTYYQTSFNKAGTGLTITSANQVRGIGFIPPTNVTFGKIAFWVGTADSDATHLYSLGIYSISGNTATRVAYIDAVALTTTGSKEYDIHGGGTATLAADGRYLLAWTGGGGAGSLTMALAYDSSVGRYNFCTAVLTGSGVGGLVPGTLTVPSNCDPATAANWTLGGMYPFIGLR